MARGPHNATLLTDPSHPDYDKYFSLSVKAQNICGASIYYSFNSIIPAGPPGGGSISEEESDEPLKSQIENGSFLVDLTEEEEFVFHIFPNPTQGIVTLSLPGDIVHIELFNIDGRIILTEKIERQTQTYTMDLSHLKAGIYVIIASKSNGEKYLKRISLIN